MRQTEWTTPKRLFFRQDGRSAHKPQRGAGNQALANEVLATLFGKRIKSIPQGCQIRAGGRSSAPTSGSRKDKAIAHRLDQIRRHHHESPELFLSQPLFTATQHHRLFLRGDLEHGAAEYPSPRGNAPPPSQPGAPPREKRPPHPEG